MTSPSDKWLSDFNIAGSLADKCFADLKERNRLLRSGGEDRAALARLNNLIRRQVSQLQGDIGVLDDALAKMYESPTDFGLTEKELQRRKDMVSSLTYRKNELMHDMRSQAPSGGASGAARDSLFARPPEKQMQPWRPPEETDETRAQTNEEILTTQKQIVGQQDDNLELLSDSLGRQKHIGLAISEELDLHSRLLNDVDRDVDKVGSRLKSAGRMTARITKKQRNCAAICAIVILIAIFATLAATDWGCEIVYPKEKCHGMV